MHAEMWCISVDMCYSYIFVYVHDVVICVYICIYVYMYVYMYIYVYFSALIGVNTCVYLWVRGGEHTSTVGSTCLLHRYLALLDGYV